MYLRQHMAQIHQQTQVILAPSCTPTTARRFIHSGSSIAESTALKSTSLRSHLRNTVIRASRPLAPSVPEHISVVTLSPIKAPSLAEVTFSTQVACSVSKRIFVNSTILNWKIINIITSTFCNNDDICARLIQSKHCLRWNHCLLCWYRSKSFASAKCKYAWSRVLLWSTRSDLKYFSESTQ